MAYHAINDPVEFKPTSGLGGWRPGTVTGYVGRLIEVTDGRSTWCVKPSQVRKPKAEAKPGRAARQAEARAQRLVMTERRDEGDEPMPEGLDRFFGAVPDLPEPIVSRPKAPKPTRSAAFLKWTRMQACAITGDPAEVAHHYENAGRGRKCSDYMTVPLTDAAHRGWHDASDAWLAHAGESARARGESYDLIATRLAMAEAGWRALVAFLERQDEEGSEET